MNLTATKEFTWDMAHMLEGHLGLCKNVHGHTYKMHVTVASRNPEGVITEGPAKGMVCDFKTLKEVVNKYIVEPLDHAFMYNIDSEDPVERKIAQILVDADRKTAPVQYRPTAENMSKHFYEGLKEILSTYSFDVVEVTVWETPTSFARYNG